MAAYKAFLTEIGYLVPEGPDFTVTTKNVDPEIAQVAGPQLVVPVMNARYALNAANARWGSLYDALYGTDAIAEQDGAEKTKGYNPVRGARVIAWARNFLDQSVPLAKAKCKWADVSRVFVDGAVLMTDLGGLKAPSQFKGWRGPKDNPAAVLLANNGLHIEIAFDRAHLIGKDDKAGISDVILESALTTIMDCEDSVAAVDAADKVTVYRNWLGLMKGDLAEEIEKGGKTFTRRLNPDRTYEAPDGGTVTLPGRSLMLVRNVGHLMTNAGDPRRGGPRGAGRHHGCDDDGADRHPRHRPQGPAHELARRLDLYREAQDARAGRSGLRGRTVRARRAGAGPCAQHHEDRHHGRGAAHHHQPQGMHPRRRRTASSSSTPASSTAPATRSTAPMEAGPMIRKGDMKQAPWIKAYEDWNVDIGPALRPSRPRADRQGHVGDPRPHGDHAVDEARAIRRRAPTRPGCRRPPRRRCMPRIITR